MKFLNVLYNTRNIYIYIKVIKSSHTISKIRVIRYYTDVLTFHWVTSFGAGAVYTLQRVTVYLSGVLWTIAIQVIRRL